MADFDWSLDPTLGAFARTCRPDDGSTPVENDRLFSWQPADHDDSAWDDLA